MRPEARPDPEATEEEEGERLSLTAPPEAAGTRLDLHLAAALPRFSRTRLQAVFAAGLVRISPGKAKPGWRLRGGEQIDLLVPAAEPLDAEPEPMPLRILHEDRHLIVIDKPAGLVVHPCEAHPRGTLVNGLLAHCRDLAGIGGTLRPGIVHRLDRETSGCLVAAKTDLAHRALCAQFADRTVEKTYLAWTAGAPETDEGTVEGPIGRDPTDRRRRAMVDGGRESLTRWRVAERFAPAAPGLPPAARLECRPATGRTHQIRVHLLRLGCPIWFDPLYATPTSVAAAARLGLRLASPRLCLHAWRLAFDHPEGGGRLRFEAGIPADLAAIEAALAGARRAGRGTPS